MARQVFVSYSQSDRACAFELLGVLESQGISCWIAPRDIEPSADWAAEIIDAIGAAQAMVLIFSSSSNDSPQVRREVERAVHKQVPVLPFRIENVLPSKSLEFFLSAQHWLDAFPPPREPHYAALCAHLRKVFGNPEGAPAVLPVRREAAAPAQGIGAADLQRLEGALALHVGPIARLLVARAARRGGSLEEVAERLRGEIDTESDQCLFLESARRRE